MTATSSRPTRRARATWLLGLARALGAQLPPAITQFEDELWHDRRLATNALAEIEACLVDEDLPTFTTQDAVVNSALVALHYADSPDSNGSDDQVEEVVDLLIQSPHATRYQDVTVLTRDVLRDITNATASRVALDASAQSWAMTFRSLPWQ